MTVTCTNSDCTEHGAPKNVPFELLPGETVTCGDCGQPCAPVEGTPK